MLVDHEVRVQVLQGTQLEDNVRVKLEPSEVESFQDLAIVHLGHRAVRSESSN